MTLTPLAEGLAEPVREFLLQAEFILQSNPVFEPGQSTRRFRLRMSDYVETVVMSEALPRVKKIAPQVTFELFSNEGTGGLERGEIDLAITPRKYLAEGHPIEPLFEDDYVCVAWAENEQVGEKISLDEYLEFGHVIVRLGSQRELPAYDEWLLERGDHQRRIEVITTTFNLVPQLLIGTPRIATLHRRLYRFYQRYLPLKAISLPLELPQIEECMQWHRSRTQDPGLLWLRAILKQVVVKNLPQRDDSAKPSTRATTRKLTRHR